MNKKLELKETPDKGVYVKDLMQFVVKGSTELNSVQAVSAIQQCVQQQYGVLHYQGVYVKDAMQFVVKVSSK